MTVWLDEELLAALLKRAADEGLRTARRPCEPLSNNGLISQPDIHRSARKYYVKDYLGDEDLRHAYGHVLNSRRWMIWTARRRAVQASGGRSSGAGDVALSKFAELYG